MVGASSGPMEPFFYRVLTCNSTSFVNFSTCAVSTGAAGLGSPLGLAFDCLLVFPFFTETKYNVLALEHNILALEHNVLALEYNVLALEQKVKRSQTLLNMPLSMMTCIGVTPLTGRLESHR